MTSKMTIAGVFLVSSLLAAPALAASLLGGVVSTGGNAAGTAVTAPGVAGVTVGGNPSGGTDAGATLLNGGGAAIDVGLDDILGNRSNVRATLPGAGTALPDSVTTVNGTTANGGTVDTLIGDLLGGGTVIGGSGGNGVVVGGLDGAGGLDGGDGGAVIIAGNDVSAGGLAPAAGSGGRCINDAEGVSRLLQARYDHRVVSNWAQAGSIRVVPVKLCAGLRTSVQTAAAASGSIGFLRGAAAGNPAISSSLSRNGRSPDDVLAIGQSNGTVSVYVY